MNEGVHMQAKGLHVRSADLGPGVMGLWDAATRTIWLDRALSTAERRCTLMHELIHVERGDTACDSDWFGRRQEVAVHAEASRRLIRLDELAAALRFCADDHEVADELVVDLETLRVRLAGLSAHERAQLDRHGRDVAGWHRVTARVG